MKKLIVLGMVLLCSTYVYAQETMVLDDAIIDSVLFFSSKLQTGSTIAVANIDAETKELADFIISELSIAFANTGNVRIVERNRLELLQSELNFNMSGSVSDETAQGIGRMIGAQIIFSGDIKQFRNIYRLRIQAIAVETAEIIGARTINVNYDPTLTGLLGRINPADQWKYNWIYLGLHFGYTAMVMKPDNTNDLVIPVNGGLFGIIQPFDFFGIALDVFGQQRNVSISIAPTVIIRPSLFDINIFFGFGYNVAEGMFTAGMAGVRSGYHIGAGVIYADIRVTSFFIPETHYDWPYITANFSLGYQIGLIPRKK